MKHRNTVWVATCVAFVQLACGSDRTSDWETGGTGSGGRSGAGGLPAGGDADPGQAGEGAQAAGMGPETGGTAGSAGAAGSGQGGGGNQNEGGSPSEGGEAQGGAAVAGEGQGGDAGASSGSGGQGGSSGNGGSAGNGGGSGGTGGNGPDLYVDPASGNDESAGTRAAPLKTIAHASERASTSGARKIWLLDGVYGASSEAQFAATAVGACGVGSGVRLPKGLSLEAEHAGKARLVIGGTHGLCFEGGRVRGLALERATAAGRVLEASAGNLDVSETTFAKCGNPGVAGTAGGTSEACLLVSGGAEVALRGAAASAWLGTNVGTFLLAREEAKVSLSAGSFTVAPTTRTQALFVATQNASIAAQGVKLGSSAGGIAFQAQNSAKLSLGKAELQGFDMGIRLNTASTIVQLTDVTATELAYFVYVNTTSTELGALIVSGAHVTGSETAVLVQRGNLDITVDGSTFEDNGTALALGGNGSVDISDTHIEGNEDGLRLAVPAGGLSLKLRGVQVSENSRIGVLLGGQLSGAYDLGTAASPGNNVFTDNAADAAQGANLVVSGGAALAVSAVGNTWNAGVQQASANGRYSVVGAGATLSVTGGAGPNYRVLTPPTTLLLAANP